MMKEIQSKKTDKKHKRLAGLLCTGLLCSCFILALTGCSSSSGRYTASEEHKIIFDTDTAADDAMALILAAKAPNITLKGVTVLAGNVSLEQGCKNALMTLEIADRNDVPVYAGSDTGYSGNRINPFSVFGTDGMGDLDLIHPSRYPEEEDGVDFILETVKAEPGEIEIMATGPLTNIAKAIKKDPDTMKKVKRIWAMGTGGTTYFGNATPVAEFNAYMDIDAYDCVLESGIPMTIIGYDVCNQEGVRISNAELEELAGAGKCGSFLSKSLRILVKNYGESDGYACVCDPVAVAALIWDDFVEASKSCDAEAVVHDCASKGQVIFYFQGFKYDKVQGDRTYNIDVVSDLNGENYMSNVCRLIK